MNEVNLKVIGLNTTYKQYVKLTVGAKEVDEYGKSHAVWLNEFKPDPTYKKVDTNSNVEEVDLPF